MIENVIFNDLKKNQSLKIKAIKIGDKDVEVKQYLPVNEKLAIITSIVNQIGQNDYSFPNPIQIDVYTTLAIVKAYAPGIVFSEEEEADPASLYDDLERTDVANKVVAAIPKVEYDFLIDGIEKTVSAYYAYANSAKGIMETIVQDYSNLDLDASKIQKEIADPENITLLKDIMTKLG